MMPARPSKQRGTALIIAMLFLVILGMLGVTTMTSTTLEERMAGNTRDRDIAMAAAEAALRDAERDLKNVNAAFRVVKVANFGAACPAALCTEGNAPVASITDPVKSAFYGQFTGEIAMGGPVQLPRYMIELLSNAPPPFPTTPNPPAGMTTRNFRITAWGVGKNTDTVVILQTVYQLSL
jgi:type IV pilus assembly protein PilX